MKTKAQELELRNIMEGLEEFATFMSYKSDYQNLRILSVETVEQAKINDNAHKPKAEVIPIRNAQLTEHKKVSSYHKSLKFYDKVVH